MGIQPRIATGGGAPIETLPRSAGGLSRSRRWAGILVACVGLPLLTIALVSVSSRLAAESTLMLYLLSVVVVAVVGGVVPALLAAVASFLLVNWFLTPPYHLSLIHISEPTRRTPISYAVFCLKKKK